jgi:hypothetical protein
MSSIALIDSCCEGENEFVINISQKTLSIEYLQAYRRTLAYWFSKKLPVPIGLVILKYMEHSYLVENVNLPSYYLLSLIGILSVGFVQQGSASGFRETGRKDVEYLRWQGEVFVHHSQRVHRSQLKK